MNEGEGIRLLLVGATDPALRAAAAMAREAGADVTMADDPDAALTILRTTDVALVMIDVRADVAGFMARLRAERFAVPVLGCGIDAPADRAVAAIRAGARDYVPLPPERPLIAAALATAAAMPGVALIGGDAAFLRAVAFARSIAPGRMPVLITGEPDSGRATLARAIHIASGRVGRFLTVDGTGVAANMLDGVHGGTLLIRDIDRLAPAAQVTLCAAIEGACDVRVVASTRDLAALAAEGFRADLAGRFAVARIAVPPLRYRPDDIAALATHFAERMARAEGLPPRAIRADALAVLAAYRWPGNVRELEDVVHRATVLAQGTAIAPEHLVLVDGTRLAPADRTRETSVDRLVGRTVEEVERALILKTLERCRGNRTSASGILGISVRTMRNKLKTFVEAGIAVAPAA